MGRPSGFTQEKADEICERLIDGESLRTICKDDHMPNVATVCRWLATNDTFSKQYARAREQQADTLADEILAISDDGSNDYMERLGEGGQSVGWQVNGEAIQRSRLRVDARKWYAGKLRPKVYGEKQAVEHSGPDGGPIELTHTVSAETRGLLEGLSGIGTDRCSSVSVPD